MVYRWQSADFLTGVTSPDRVLPHVPGSGNYSHDIKSNQTSSVKIHKDLLGPNGAWRNAMKRIDTMVILHDDEAAWDDPDAILTGGFINAIPATIGETVELSIGGLNEWWRLHAVCSVYNGTIADPNAYYLFQGSTWQNTLHSIIMEAHSTAGIPAGGKRPPQILGNVDGVTTTAPTLISKEDGQEFPDFSILVQPGNFKNYFNLMEETRDILSRTGNEYYVKLRWANSSKTLIRADIRIATDENPHLNFDQTKTIYFERDGDLSGYLDGQKDYHVLDVELNQNGDGYANRIIAQSNAGGNDEDADFTAKLSTAGPEVLVDTFYNPNVKLTPTVLDNEMTKRLNDAVRYQVQGTVTLFGNPAEWNNHLGKRLYLVEQTADSDDPMQGFGRSEELRISDIKVTPSENRNEAKIVVGFVTPATRYPSLPREFKKSDPFGLDTRNATNSPVIVGKPYNDPNFDYSGSAPAPIMPASDGLTDWGNGKTTPDSPDSARLAVGYAHSLAIDSAGRLWGWGSNGAAELGLGSYPTENGGQGGDNGKAKYTYPQRIGTDTDWAAVYAWGQASFGIKKDGRLYEWGSREQTGGGYIAVSPQYLASNVKKLQINLEAGYIYKTDGSILNLINQTDATEGHPLVSIHNNNTTNISSYYYAALDTDGRLWESSFENNGSGWQRKPWTNTFPNLHFKDISVAESNYGNLGYYCAGIEATTGQLYTWGGGYHGTPDNALSDRIEPMPFGIDIGAVHSFPRYQTGRPMGTILYIRADNGELWAVGKGGGSVSLINDWPQPIHYGMGTNFDWRKDHVICMTGQNCLAIINDGELWVGGQNYIGELGIGPVGRRSDNLFRVGTTNKWRAVITVDTRPGWYGFSLAIHDGDMFATGWNGYGQLGLGAITYLGYLKFDNFDTQYSWSIQPTSKEPTS